MTKHRILLFLAVSMFLGSCSEKKSSTDADTGNKPFVWKTEQFADLKLIRYQVPSWDSLSLRQKKLVYYLTQAGLAGRDMIWAQNYRHNLSIRAALEHILTSYKGEKTADWEKFVTYTKRVWFSNGIHHHYSNQKFEPGFPETYFRTLLKETGYQLEEEVIRAMFDPAVDSKKVNLDASSDLVAGSAVNFYGPGLTQKEVEAYYAANKSQAKIETGLNSRLVRGTDGKIREEVYKVGGLFGPALEKVNYWLSKAVEVAENQQQADALKLLIEYYNTGDLEKWAQYNIAWVKATEGDIDYIQGFVEVYNDPLSYKGTYESIVQIKDFEASRQMKVMQDNAQWFEDNSPILPEHKKKNVVGITYNVVNVAGESGDASPSTPIGVNLPNANWIRQEHGSKSVSLGNIIYAYEMAGGQGLVDEFAYTPAEKERAKKYAALAGKLHTAMHEVIGHASGQINPGIGTPKETLRSFSSALEEARADLVGLYYALDPKLVEWKLVESAEVGKAEYDSYIRNGLMLQLRRLKEGEDIEEAHMRNRQLVAAWAFEKGQAEKVIEKKVENGKTYFVINDYEKLRQLFGQLLKEIQRITSEGDYLAGKNLIEKYAVKVDPALHKEVLERSAKLNDAPYGGFINPKLVPVIDANGEITDVRITYPEDFSQQMLEYSKEYGFLKAGTQR